MTTADGPRVLTNRRVFRSGLQFVRPAMRSFGLCSMLQSLPIHCARRRAAQKGRRPSASFPAAWCSLTPLRSARSAAIAISSSFWGTSSITCNRTLGRPPAAAPVRNQSLMSPSTSLVSAYASTSALDRRPEAGCEAPESRRRGSTISPARSALAAETSSLSARLASIDRSKFSGSEASASR